MLVFSIFGGFCEDLSLINSSLNSGFVYVSIDDLNGSLNESLGDFFYNESLNGSSLEVDESLKFFVEKVNLDLESSNLSYGRNGSDLEVLEVLDLFGEKKRINLSLNVIEFENDLSGVVGVSRFNGDKKLKNENLVRVKPVVRDLSRLSMGSDLVEDKDLEILSYEVFSDVDSSFYLDNFSSLGEELISIGLERGVYKSKIEFLDSNDSVFVEENFFVNGLISVNTERSLYAKNDVVRVFFVVLDKYGFPVSNAKINLSLNFPNNVSKNFDEFDIFPTEVKGVYVMEFLADFEGEYLMVANVELYDMVVEFETFFNVVLDSEILFDVVRDVPMTIDPWAGPFRGGFSIVPMNESIGESYSFTEVVSDEFEIVDSSADLVWFREDEIFLTWFNLSGEVGSSDVWYRAQVPLISPNLFELGESFVDFRTGKFYENRSWFFAIDPAGKVCSALSPCFCGSGCIDPEDGDATIDVCTDGNHDYEFISNIEVESVSENYFATGDEVNVKVSYTCDSSGFASDRVRVYYKGDDSAWVNADMVQSIQCPKGGANVLEFELDLGGSSGDHFIRAVMAYSDSSTNVCSTSNWRDHDDLVFEVLEKENPVVISSLLSNSSGSFEEVDVVYGESFNFSSVWNVNVTGAKVFHNGSGSFEEVDVFGSSNEVLKVFDTSEVESFVGRGRIAIRSFVRSLFFSSLSNYSQYLFLDLIERVRVQDSSLVPNVGNVGVSSRISCLIFNDVLNVPAVGVSVDFFSNVSGFLGSSLTNGSGWGVYDYVGSSVEKHNLTCDLSSDLENFVVVNSDVGLKNKSHVLNVRQVGEDVVAPVISGVGLSNTKIQKGDSILFSATVTDDVMVGNVTLEVIYPDLSVSNFLMSNVSSLFSFSFVQGNQIGVYSYRFIALDNSSNEVSTLKESFEVVKVQAYVSIGSDSAVYKYDKNLAVSNYFSQEDVKSVSESFSGDINHFYYDFGEVGSCDFQGWTHSGSKDEWEVGVPSDGDLNTADFGCAVGTDLDNTYQRYSDNELVSPSMDFYGRSNVKLEYWKEEMVRNGDQYFMEVFDGVNWVVVDYKPINANFDNEPQVLSFPLPDLDGVSNGQFRVRFKSINSKDEGLVLDSFNFSFKPREDAVSKESLFVNSSFGSDESGVATVEVEVVVDSFSSAGSDGFFNFKPDLVVDLFDGTDFSGGFDCDLDSGFSFPYTCRISINSDDDILFAWRLAENRKVKVYAKNIDNGDSIVVSSVRRKVNFPSFIENFADIVFNGHLKIEVRDLDDNVIDSIYDSSIVLNPHEKKSVNALIPPYFLNRSVFENGVDYFLYAYFDDGFGGVLYDEVNGQYLESKAQFRIENLIIETINPNSSTTQDSNFLINITLNETFVGGGSLCNYSLDDGGFLPLTESNGFFSEQIFGEEIGEHLLDFVCVDVDGDLAYLDDVRFLIIDLLGDPWQIYYGNVSQHVVLGVDYDDMNDFGNYPSYKYVFLMNEKADLNFSELYALGRRKNGNKIMADFNDFDTVLGISSSPFNVRNTFTGGANNPIETTSYDIAGRTIDNVAVVKVNSSSGTPFRMGVLWDGSDSNNNNYDTNEKEDVVFVVEILEDTAGHFGVSDYEAKVPQTFPLLDEGYEVKMILVS